MNTTLPYITTQPLLHLPAMRGVIERRILVNFRCDPDVLARLVPAPFRPKLIRGWGMAGICLVRLGNVHPAGLPALCGLTSENAAHRIAVEWDDHGETCTGVFIPRRDTDSLLNRLAGGRLFSGEHHAATYRVWETNERFKVEMRSHDGTSFARVLTHLTDALPEHSIFRSLAEASDFFREGSTGWSARRQPDTFDGVELCCDEWHMQPLAAERIESSFFTNQKLFPRGSAIYDSAFVMRDIAHTWHGRGRLNGLDAL